MSSLPINQSSPTPAGVGLRLQDSPAQEHPENSNPLSEAHLHQIALATKRAKPIRKAVRYASFSGWTTLMAGALSLPFAIGNTPMLVFALVIAGIGTRELTLHRRLKVLDIQAPKKLAINQLMLGGSLICYAVYMLLSVPEQGVVESAMASDPMLQSTPELAGMFDDLIILEQVATALIYVGMIVLAVFFQGGTALYYLLKGFKLKKMHKQTPDWVVQVYQTVHS